MGQREELRVQTLKQDTAYMLINELGMQGNMVLYLQDIPGESECILTVSKNGMLVFLL